MVKKKDITKQIKAFQLQAQGIMNDTAVPVDERIQRTADIYRQAENLAEEGSLEEKAYESLLTDSSRFYAEYCMYKDAIPRYLKLIELRESLFGLEHPDTAEAYYNMGMMYFFADDNVKAYEYFLNAHQFYEKCSSSEYIERKIKEVESYIDLIEDKPAEEAKGTRDLFLETLTKIGCQYEIDPDEGYISFGYQGEKFLASATNEGWYVRLWDTYWGHVELYDADEFARLKKAINNANLNCTTMTVYTINEEAKKVDVHCKSIFPLMPQMSDLENYLRGELNDFFNAHHYVGNEMAKLREQDNNESNDQAN